MTLTFEAYLQLQQPSLKREHHRCILFVAIQCLWKLLQQRCCICQPLSPVWTEELFPYL